MWESRSALWDKVTNKRLFTCRRCGWTGRRSWKDTDFDYSNYYAPTEAVADPGLTVLDHASAKRASSPRTVKRRRSTRAKSKDFDLKAVMGDTATTADPETERIDVDTPATSANDRLQRRRRKRDQISRSRRREVVATVAVTSLALFVTVLIAMGQGCRPSPDF